MAASPGAAISFVHKFVPQLLQTYPLGAGVCVSAVKQASNAGAFDHMADHRTIECRTGRWKIRRRRQVEFLIKRVDSENVTMNAVGDQAGRRAWTAIAKVEGVIQNLLARSAPR